MKRKTSKPSKFRIMAEYGSSGIWLIEQQGVFRHVGVSYSYLNLSIGLTDQFSKWIEYYNNQLVNADDFDVEISNKEGLRLAKELKKYLGDDSSVEFQGETSSGALITPVQIDAV